MGFLTDLRAGSALRKTIRFPGTDRDIDITILTDAEEQAAEFAAERLFVAEKIAIAFHNADQYANELTLQKLYRSLKLSGSDDPLEPSITEFKSHITPIERDLLVDEFNAFCEQFNPSPRTMGDEEFDALVENLKKNAGMTIGKISSFATLKRLALYLAKERSIAPTDSGATSSQ